MADFTCAGEVLAWCFFVSGFLVENVCCVYQSGVYVLCFEFEPLVRTLLLRECGVYGRERCMRSKAAHPPCHSVTLFSLSVTNTWVRYSLWYGLAVVACLRVALSAPSM